jgi:hypothetical protein
MSLTVSGFVGVESGRGRRLYRGILGRCIRHEPVAYEAHRARCAEPEHALRGTSRDSGTPADDLQHAADFSEIMLAMQLGKRQSDTLALVEAHVVSGGTLWS